MFYSVRMESGIIIHHSVYQYLKSVSCSVIYNGLLTLYKPISFMIAYAYTIRLAWLLELSLLLLI